MRSETNTVQPLRLRDMPHDVLMLFFVDLDLQSLLNIVEFDRALLDSAFHSFRAKYRNQTFIIKGSFDDELRANRPNLNSFSHQPNAIECNSFETGLNLLEYFGGAITNMVVDYEAIELNGRQTINAYIQRVCSELQSFQMINYDSTELDAFHQMPSVEIIDYANVRLENMGKLTNKSFPNMRRLNVRNIPVSDSMSLAIHFPALEHLDVGYCTFGFPTAQINGLIRHNPQIRYLKLSESPADFLEEVNDRLPNLKYLGLSWQMINFFTQKYKVIHFENVRSFALSGLSILGDYPFALNPNRLEELRLGIVYPQEKCELNTAEIAN